MWRAWVPHRFKIATVGQVRYQISLSCWTPQAWRSMGLLFHGQDPALWDWVQQGKNRFYHSKKKEVDMECYIVMFENLCDSVWLSLPADVLWGSFVSHSFLTNEPQRMSAGRLGLTVIDRISCEGRKLLNLHRLLSTHIEIGMPVCYVQIQIKICRGYVIPYFLCINIPNFTILINSKKMIQFMLPLRQF